MKALVAVLSAALLVGLVYLLFQPAGRNAADAPLAAAESPHPPHHSVSSASSPTVLSGASEGSGKTEEPQAPNAADPKARRREKSQRQREEALAAMPDWQRGLELIENTVSDPQTRLQIFTTQIHSLPVQGQHDAVARMSRLTNDENYDTVLPAILDGSLAESTLNALLGNLTTRSPEVQNRTLQQIANRPGHPLQETAAAMLRAHTQTPAGSGGTIATDTVPDVPSVSTKDEDE